MLSFFPRDVLQEIWDLIEPVSEGFPTYSYIVLNGLSLLWSRGTVGKVTNSKLQVRSPVISESFLSVAMKFY